MFKHSFKSKMTDLDKWLEKQNYFKRSKDVPIPSHLMYTGYKGGKIYVPRDKDYNFLCKYAEELDKGSKLYYVETRPKTFKFMIDLDITDEYYWEVSKIIELVKIIQTIISEFFENNQVVICCSSSEKKKKDGTHTGVHLIWPNLVVVSDNALIIRRGIIQKLKELDVKTGTVTIEEVKKPKSWDSTIDEVIYTRNGYRMVGSDKMGTDKVPENRPLELLFVMNSDGELSEGYYNRLKNSNKALMLETSIRYVLDAYLTQGMEIKQPIWLEEDIVHKKAGKGSSVGTIVSGKEHQVVEEFIKINLPKQFRGVVKAVTRYPDNNLLIKTNSKYCMNMGRNHNSCGIYFFASPIGLYQKCLCTCDKLEGRKHGLCCDYTSECYPFSDKIKDILFPDSKKNLFLEEKKKQDSYKFVPETKQTLEREQEILCNKLLGDILIDGNTKPKPKPKPKFKKKT